MSVLVWGCDALFLLRLHFVLSADKSGVGKNLGTTRFRRLSIRRLIDTVCIHLFPPTLAPEAVTLHSVTWFVSPRPWGFFLFFFFIFGLQPDGTSSQVGRWTRPAPSPGRHAGSGQTKPSDSFSPPPENISLFLPPAFPVKQMIFCSRWLRNTHPLVRVPVWSTDNQTMASPCCCQCILFCLGNVCLQTFVHCCSPLLFMVNFATEMFILLLGGEKKTYLFALFCNFFPPLLFGENNLDCTIKNYRLWIFPQIINSTSEEKCHLLFNAWLLGLMAGSLILKVESLFGNNVLNLRRFNKRRGVFFFFF